MAEHSRPHQPVETRYAIDRHRGRGRRHTVDQAVLRQPTGDSRLSSSVSLAR
jgi:hypothetical protein